MVRAAFVALLVAVAVPTAGAAGPLRTAVYAGDRDPLVFERIHDAGATVVRINVSWRHVAPTQPPAGFRPSDPADPAYRWDSLDRLIREAAAHELQPLLTVHNAPFWAQKDEPHPTHLGPYPIDSWRPDPAQFGAFARALALRYGGTFQGLPRVRYWEVWNEPNLSQYLSPQEENGHVVSADVYRSLVNALADAVHGVHADNVVAAGALSAFSFATPYGRLGIAPLLFMRRLLCMSAGSKPKPTCAQRVSFDVWSHHPWTSGGPTHHATEKDDVSLGDLPRMRRLLDAADRAGHIRASRAPELWVTEFEWDTRPPDAHPLTAPLPLQSRWVAEALYQSWKAGVSLFTWLLLWDQLYPTASLQGGLFYRNGEDFRYAQAKPTFSAFRFPFVAYKRDRRIFVWGRTPYGRPGPVAIQQRTAARWVWAGEFKANRYGIFSGLVRGQRIRKAAKAARPTSSGTRYRDVVVSGAPTSYWRLDEREGPTATDTRRRDDGTFVGGVRYGLRGAVPGSTAIGLDGRGRVKLGAVTNVHSVELWVKTRSLTYGDAFSSRDAQHRYVELGMTGGLAHSHDDYPIFAAPIANGQWHHLVYTYDTPTSTGKVYVDGKLSNFAVYPRREGGAEASIGYDATLKLFFKGQVDEVSVYSYPLNVQQVRQHYLASGRRIALGPAPGTMRAVEQHSGISSLPFSLQRPRDRFVLPFGGGGPGT